MLCHKVFIQNVIKVHNVLVCNNDVVLLLSSLVQPSPSTSSLSSNHSASPNVTSSAPSSARGETAAHFTALPTVDFLPIFQSRVTCAEEADRGSAGQTEHGDLHL